MSQGQIEENQFDKSLLTPRTPPIQIDVSNCVLCSNIDTSTMIICINCNSKFHNNCVKLSSDIDPSTWQCRTCRKQRPNENQQQIRRKPTVTETPKADLPTLSHPTSQKPSSQTLVEQVPDQCEKRGLLSTGSSKQRQLKLAMARLEEERLLKEKRDKEYLDEKYRIESEFGSDSSEEGDGHRTENWINDQNRQVSFNTTHIDLDEFTLLGHSEREKVDRLESGMAPGPSNLIHGPKTNYPANPRLQLQKIYVPQSSKEIHEHTASKVTSCPWLGARSQRTFLNSTSFKKPDTGEELGPVNVSLRQITLRQGISKDLPPFSGDPTEWPLFISNYIRSAREGAFSDEENLIRLQKCLKGNAFNAVRCHLIYPETIPQVLNTLRMLFGRPQLVIHTMIEQIRKEPMVNPEQLETIVEFAMAVQHLCATMEASEMEDHLNNPVLLQELVDKLPGTLKLNWASFMHTKNVVNLQSFNKWLFDLADAASNVVTLKSPDTIMDRKGIKNTNNRRNFVNATHAVQKGKRLNNEKNPQTITRGPKIESCSVCSESHRIDVCQQFLRLTKKERWDSIRSKKLCRKCLGAHHASRCRLFKECEVNGCKFKHHPLLHDSDIHSQPSTTKTESTVATTTNLTSRPPVHKELLFRIVPVVLYGVAGSVKSFAFLDEGSSFTLIDKELANLLKLEGPEENLHLKWTGNTTRLERNSRRVSLEISGIGSNNSKYSIGDVRTVSTLSLLEQTLNLTNSCQNYDYLRDLPIHQYKDAKPGILIGLQHWQLAIPLQIREGNWNEPMAAETRLGWTVFGPLHHYADTEDQQAIYHITQTNTDDDLHRQIGEFFSTENFGVKCPIAEIESKDERRANQILKKTTKIVNDRYITGLIWRFDKIELPNSFPLAMRRLICLERKMAKDPVLAQNLHQQIRDYVSKGYARKLSPDEAKISSDRTWYLPVFPVINPKKPGKIRLVWDAAAEINGVSLNSVLMPGPDLLSPLSEILQRFRENPVAIAADIKEMFHQIGIINEDQSSQRFLWRWNEYQSPDVYVMAVMTFGATCSPSCAQYIKNINAARFEKSNPRANFAISQNHYVDDWLDSFQTNEDAIKIAKDVIKIHKSGGFEIRNFISNSERVLTALGSKCQDEKKDLNMCSDSNKSTAAKVLGMWWSTIDDCFYFSLNMDRIDSAIVSGIRKPTKREVLRIVMMVFDPLGLISTVIVYAKILLRDIWKSGTTWDQEIDDVSYSKWIRWTSILSELVNIRIPRCYSVTGCQSIELHVFVDASEAAFAAAAYFRIESTCETFCRLVGAKTKVAPQRAMSIPRLELQSAVLGARLATLILKAHTIVPTRKVFWSDSKDVLIWLRSEKRYRQFVAFRTSEILETTKSTDWRWVPSRFNVADEATKWKTRPDLSADSCWFAGPPFLSQPEESWPTTKFDIDQSTTDEEEKVMATHGKVTPFNIVPDATVFSRWRQFLRSTAYATRFFYFGKGKNLTKGALTCDEIQTAENEIYRMVQLEAYPEVISSLKDSPDRPLDKSCQIYKLTPFLDSSMVLRLKGRANRTVGVSYDCLNPIILPHEHQVTRLIVAAYHRKYHHQNHETTINELRQKYVITRLRVLLKKVRADCQRCKNDRARPLPPLMGDHPFARVASFSAPFSYTGIDYFGPLEVIIGRRIEKRWIALFTCLTIRAVHLEVVHTLNKRSCLMAIRNFISRRGTPLEIRTDCGTNFKGVSNELQLLRKEFKPEDYQHEFDNIKWIFNTPAAPHQGGCWEILVRSIKRCLFASMPSRRPDDETLRCFLMEAESTVNSRPLTYIPIDEDSDEAITPNSFLLGSTSGIKPLTKFDDGINSLVRNFELSQRMADHFWKRWVREYLPVLTRTTKWFTPVKKIEVGDFVIIINEKERNSWQKGVVIDTIIGGRREQVRKVTVKTIHGIYDKPASKVAVLDVKPRESITTTQSRPFLPRANLKEVRKWSCNAQNKQKTTC